MLCNYIFQNLVLLLGIFIYLFFMLKNMSKKIDYTKTKFEDLYEIWRNYHGWKFIIGSVLTISFSLYGKIPSISIILNIFGIKTCQ